VASRAPRQARIHRSAIWPVVESARCTVRLASCTVCGREWLAAPFCGAYPPGDEYELVVQDIVNRLARRAGVEATHLEHDVEMSLGGPPARTPVAI
jgi:hypothetical protein